MRLTPNQQRVLAAAIFIVLMYAAAHILSAIFHSMPDLLLDITLATMAGTSVTVILVHHARRYRAARKQKRLKD